MKRLVVGVMGSGENSWEEYSIPLGKWLAQNNYHLITGSGKGVMISVAQAFCTTDARLGLSIGVVPTEQTLENTYISKAGYPNPWVEMAIISPLSTFTGEDPNQVSRNHIIILTSHVIVALPGSKGTRNEVALALRFQKPLILFGPDKEFSEFPEEISRTNHLNKVQEFVELIKN